jgi:predicted TIM-barrel fold metal-dependent hydrolase
VSTLEHVQDIKRRLGTPVVDGDGHQIEYVPAVRSLIREQEGAAAASRFDGWLNGMITTRRFASFWTLPTENTLDRATVMLPRLLCQRLEAIGIDYALLYPTLGLSAMRCPDDELRQQLARGLNSYYAETFEDFRDRLEPVAFIPMFSPTEALNELHHAIEELGLKAVMMSGNAIRSTRAADGTVVERLETVGFDSSFDYEPVWQKCADLKVVPTFHGSAMGHGTRASKENYVYNHLGCFAAAQESVCRSLVIGGVPSRHPELNFAFLEGGASWACQLLGDLVSHWEKRNKRDIGRYDPAALNTELMKSLFDQYATGRLAACRSELAEDRWDWAAQPGPNGVDDFVGSGLAAKEDIQEIFANQLFFGCEGDDPMNAAAFDTTLRAAMGRINAVFASDIGHWDVPDIGHVLAEAWELVEEGPLDEQQFSDFTFGNVVRQLGRVNPDFFVGTAVETEAARLLRC